MIQKPLFFVIYVLYSCDHFSQIREIIFNIYLHAAVIISIVSCLGIFTVLALLAIKQSIGRGWESCVSHL